MKKLGTSKRAGRFLLSSNREVYGELKVSGAHSLLYLQDKDKFDPLAIPDNYLAGVLSDLTKVSLIQCVPNTWLGHFTRADETYYFAEIFPHYVVQGHMHIRPSEKSVTKVHFRIDDATALFSDFVFGTLFDASSVIEAVVKAAKLPAVIGPHPQVAYFTGKIQIFQANTGIGKVSASHAPTTRLGGPKGVGFRNKIYVTVEFGEPVTFDHSVKSILPLLRFFEMIVGRPQNLLGLSVCAQSNQQNTFTPMDVYWNLGPSRKEHSEARKPQSYDVLIDASREPGVFADVLSKWLERESNWRDARIRFSDCFSNQGWYPIDRLIAAANMFDILPDTAVPAEAPLPCDVQEAKSKSCEIFRALPRSEQRDNFLNALGWASDVRLKHKIRHRAGILLAAVGAAEFPELTLVTDAAVDCRNHYVHGSEAKFDYNQNYRAVIFFSKVLEFVFAASDLIEAGWDAKAWSTRGTLMSHPFAALRINYPEHLRELKVLLGADGEGRKRTA